MYVIFLLVSDSNITLLPFVCINSPIYKYHGPFHHQFSRRRMAYKIWYNSHNTILFVHYSSSSDIMRLPSFAFKFSLSTFLFCTCTILSWISMRIYLIIQHIFYWLLSYYNVVCNIFQFLKIRNNLKIIWTTKKTF